MIALIRRALDARRLTTELEAAEVKIILLKAELSSHLLGPSFREVAKDFDASAMWPTIIDRVVNDLAPILEQDALAFLKTAMRSLPKDTKSSPLVAGAVAYNEMSKIYQFEFRVGAMGTMIKAHI